MNHQKNALCCQTLMRVSNKTPPLRFVLLSQTMKNRNKSTLYTFLFFKTLTNPFLQLFFVGRKRHL